MPAPLEGDTTGLSIIQGILTQLQSDVGTILPIALGIAALVFTTFFLWKKSKKVASAA